MVEYGIRLIACEDKSFLSHHSCNPPYFVECPYSMLIQGLSTEMV